TRSAHADHSRVGCQGERGSAGRPSWTGRDLRMDRDKLRAAHPGGPSTPEREMRDMMDAAPTTTGYRDPVCGMNVREDAPLRGDYAGETYRFCGAGCLAKFKADPERFLKKSAPPSVPPADQVSRA